MSTITASTSSSSAYSSVFSKQRTNDDDGSTRAGEPLASLMAGLSGQTSSISAVSTDSSASGSSAQAISSMTSMMMDRKMPPPPPQEDSTSQNSDSTSVSDMYSAMDTDGDGSVSEAEFMAAKPDGVSDQQSAALYASIDTEGAGSITEEQLASSIEQAGRQGGPQGTGGNRPPPPPSGSSDSSSSSSSSDLSSYLSSLDTDGDGSVSATEFLAAKPDDVSDEMAQKLFDSLDAQGSGSISLVQLESLLSGDGTSGTSSTSQS